MYFYSFFTIFAPTKKEMKENSNEGCFVYILILIFCICIAGFLLVRPSYCKNYNEYVCSPTSDDIHCIECNDGSIIKLDYFWSNWFIIEPCKQKGGVKAYKCKKCL